MPARNRLGGAISPTVPTEVHVGRAIFRRRSRHRKIADLDGCAAPWAYPWAEVWAHLRTAFGLWVRRIYWPSDAWPVRPGRTGLRGTWSRTRTAASTTRRALWRSPFW